MACSGCARRRTKIREWVLGLIGAAPARDTRRRLQELDAYLGKKTQRIEDLGARVKALEIALLKKEARGEVRPYELHSMRDG